jgi:hypothetical protein
MNELPLCSQELKLRAAVVEQNGFLVLEIKMFPCFGYTFYLTVIDSQIHMTVPM